MSSFSVVEFVDEVDSDGCKKVDIVPSEWFHDAERKLCWWPPASLVNVTKAVKEGTPPTSNWILCNVRVMGNAGKFDFICTLHLYFLFFKSLYMHIFFYLEAFVNVWPCITGNHFVIVIVFADLFLLYIVSYMWYSVQFML